MTVNKNAMHHGWETIWRESMSNEQIARRAAIILVQKPVLQK